MWEFVDVTRFLSMGKSLIGRLNLSLPDHSGDRHTNTLIILDMGLRGNIFGGCLLVNVDSV